VKVVILCAGYATRLYPLTLNCPKPLLPVGGRPLLNVIVNRIEELGDVGEIFVVTNERFFGHFEAWARELGSSKKIKVLNDGSTTNENRLGAIRDLDLALQKAGISEDCLVVAGDNLFQFSLRGFVAGARRRSAVALGVVDVKSREAAKRYGIVETDGEGRIARFLEKPDDPPTTLASMGLYFIPAQKLFLIGEYLREHENPDAPGYFFRWLLGKEPVYAHPFEGGWFDIGDLESYESAARTFTGLSARPNSGG
jgi:glucose-1-phosphate thymidylyltransferase